MQYLVSRVKAGAIDKPVIPAQAGIQGRTTKAGKE